MPETLDELAAYVAASPYGRASRAALDGGYSDEQAEADADPFAETVNAALAGVEIAPTLTPREAEKARLVALVLSPEESDTVRAQAAEELFALGRLVELDYQLSKLRDFRSGDVRRQAG